MKLQYYPGCTLKLQGKIFEDTSIKVAKQLGIEFNEIPNWNCCGTVYGIASDNLMQQIAPLRVLTRVKKSGGDKVVTLCAMCYNTLKQANHMVKDNKEKKDKLNKFLTEAKDEKLDYNGEVEILHFLEVLKKHCGMDKIAQHVKNPLKQKIAPYYGCLLTRPRHAAIDDVENPTVLSDLIKALGGEPAEFPFELECCGSYETVNKPDIVSEKTYQILDSAVKNGAEAVIVSCPMCYYNLDKRQEKMNKKVPIYYFTELMAKAFNI